MTSSSHEPPRQSSPQSSRQSSKQRQGQHFEQLALTHLQQHGLVLVARNYWCRVGEIDLVLRERDTLVFVEVRFRRGAEFGSALASVVRRKQLRVIRAAQHFLQRYPRHATSPCRFDVVALSTDAARGAQIEWVRNAFE
jgi:putative endonuclease